MSYTQDEILEFESRWTDYIDDLARLKLAAPVEYMDEITEAQELLHGVVESAVESYREDAE